MQEKNLNATQFDCILCQAIHIQSVRQKKTRKSYYNKTTECEELLTQAKLPSLVHRTLQDILILIYKVKNSLAPEHTCDIFYKQFKN